MGVIIGRSSEYFDFFVFGIASVLVFPSLLFPFMSRLDGTLMAFAIFALAFVARPVGTAISMAVQRRWGRGTKLTLALFLLGACTAGMAFLPSYASVGSTAIVALVILRIGQGLALGGTWDGLPSLLAMSAPQERRGWFAMIGQLGAPVGFVLAASLFAYLYGSLSTAEFLDWGWRYPFFVAFAINVVALFARLRLVVGQSYAELLQQRELQPVSVSQVVRDEGGNVPDWRVCRAGQLCAVSPRHGVPAVVDRHVFRTVHHRGAERADRRRLPGGGGDHALGLAGRPHRAGAICWARWQC